MGEDPLPIGPIVPVRSLTANVETGTHTLTLEHGLGQTVYFSDRPSRDVGATPTPRFLNTLGFSADNPPNAALIVDTEMGIVQLDRIATNRSSYDRT
jgi:hypothetical protein